MSKSAATTKTAEAKPAKAAKPTATAKASPKLKAVAPVVNKTPEAKPAPAKRTRKPAAAKVETVTVAPVAPVVEVPKQSPELVNKLIDDAMTRANTANQPAKRGVGRPISSEAAKVRRRVVGAFVKLAAAGEIEVTVKATAKTVKLKKVTVSNTIRWAESEGILTRIGYKLKSGPGRKEVFYTINADKLAEAAKEAA
jgi:hypothetical protein